MRWALLVTFVLALAAPLASQGLAAAPPPATAAASEPAYLKEPSLQHSVLKATTFRVATAVAQTAVLSSASGSVTVGVILAMFDSAKSSILYAMNDYAWDMFAPARLPSKADTQFDVAGSFWRNTGEFLTFKPADTALRFAGFYLFTGSGTTALAWNGLSSFATTAAFFVNNVMWDFYEWSVERDVAPPTARTAP